VLIVLVLFVGFTVVAFGFGPSVPFTVGLGFRGAPSRSGGVSVLFITNGSGGDCFGDWQGVLGARGFQLTETRLETFVGNPGVADGFDVIVLGSSCTGLTQGDAEVIAGAGKPVLAVGSGGCAFLGLLGAEVTPVELAGVTGVHSLSLSTNYNGWDIHWHIVYQQPVPVNYSTTYHYGEVAQRYLLLPLNSDNLTLVSSQVLVPLAKDTTWRDYYFLSFYTGFAGNPYLVHWALHNVSVLLDPVGEACLQVLVNTLHWLSEGNPYSVRIVPDSYGYNSSDVVNISLSVVDNLNQSLYGGVGLSVRVVDENGSVVHSDQLVSSVDGPVYTWFRVPSIASPSYTINVSDGELYFLESFSVLPTDYRVTEFNASPGTVYLGEEPVQLSARVTADGGPASGIVVFWSAIDRVTHPDASFGDDPYAYTLLDLGVTNGSGYAACEWVPERIGIYEVVAWIRDYGGSPRNWTSRTVTVSGSPQLAVNLESDCGTVGAPVRVVGNLSLCSEPLGAVSVNVTVYEPGGRAVSLVIRLSGTVAFSFEWVPEVEGRYTMVFLFPGNGTLDSVSRAVEFSVYRLNPGLETSAYQGRISLGSTLRITADFGSLGFAPSLGEPVTLVVVDSIMNRVVYTRDYVVSSLDGFEAEWTPWSPGEYRVFVYFNQSYVVATTSGVITVTEEGGGGGQPSQLVLGLSLSGNNWGNSFSHIVLTVISTGLLGVVVAFTHLRRNWRVVSE